MSVIFPDGATAVSNPANTDKILGARTSDGKIISIAYSVFRAGLQATLSSGVNIKTINGESILGAGNITISGGGGGSPTTRFLMFTTLLVEKQISTTILAQTYTRPQIKVFLI
ncbi:hypothetical protein [Pedobacter jejuensis]|uniref:Uncharacterized protein n=1 Tax=Pedobacter jejuensis TaxID=1268550 RepID=A0A3N0BPJ5_9SPHI|nr:hypothetical protein [Pedobacter jejuensis]RNL50764.1 hypothetical protein D7004_17910 [Pedobacter jejuensis]